MEEPFLTRNSQGPSQQKQAAAPGKPDAAFDLADWDVFCTLQQAAYQWLNDALSLKALLRQEHFRSAHGAQEPSSRDRLCKDPFAPRKTLQTSEHLIPDLLKLLRHESIAPRRKEQIQAHGCCIEHCSNLAGWSKPAALGCPQEHVSSTCSEECHEPEPPRQIYSPAAKQISADIPSACGKTANSNLHIPHILHDVQCEQAAPGTADGGDYQNGLSIQCEKQVPSAAASQPTPPRSNGSIHIPEKIEQRSDDLCFLPLAQSTSTQRFQQEEPDAKTLDIRSNTITQEMQTTHDCASEALHGNVDGTASSNLIESSTLNTLQNGAAVNQGSICNDKLEGSIAQTLAYWQEGPQPQQNIKAQAAGHLGHFDKRQLHDCCWSGRCCQRQLCFIP